MFNSFAVLPTIPYSIMVYLARDTSVEGENFWKMLKYGDYNALSNNNLTFSEKLELVWRTGRQDDFNIFLTNIIDDAIAESKCILKVYDYMIQPKTLYQSSIVYAFDFLYGSRMTLVEYNGVPVSRADLFVNCVCSVLNGAYIDGVGRIALDDDLSRYCGGKSVIGNSHTFTGYCLYLGILTGDSGQEIGCGD